MTLFSFNFKSLFLICLLTSYSLYAQINSSQTQSPYFLNPTDQLMQKQSSQQIKTPQTYKTNQSIPSSNNNHQSTKEANHSIPEKEKKYIKVNPSSTRTVYHVHSNQPGYSDQTINKNNHDTRSNTSSTSVNQTSRAKTSQTSYKERSSDKNLGHRKDKDNKDDTNDIDDKEDNQSDEDDDNESDKNEGQDQKDDSSDSNESADEGEANEEDAGNYSDEGAED